MSEIMNVFHDDSWAAEPWRSSEFPPEETWRERSRRFKQKPGWDDAWRDWVPRFFQFQSTKPGGWPWGYVIYRTSFMATCDQDWAAAIEKLDRYCYAKIDWPINQKQRQFWCQPNIHELVHEGYRNVVVQDPNLEGASVDVIRKRHIQWVEKRGFDLLLGIPRFDYCLFLDDRAIRSILASSEPGTSGLVGYVNVIDCDFDPNDSENECSEHYNGSLRICPEDLFQFALSCEELTDGEQHWGAWGLERPGRVIYTDGHCSIVEEQDVFLCPSQYNVCSRFCFPELPTEKPVTESEYNELQKSSAQDSQSN